MGGLGPYKICSKTTNPNQKKCSLSTVTTPYSQRGQKQIQIETN
jgi:hypothetical protein